ncbi:MAG: GGDEF domain-containing phosphodiesterase [Lachnospiraceae bacterium]|nr:GGDEF domain-containing phosphodiesterase [Lachnospiraceae bacterium]
MAVDLARYNEAFEQVLLELEKQRSWDEREVALIVAPLCRLLRIALIHVEFYGSEEDEAQRRGVVRDVYVDGTADKHNPCVMRETNIAENVICYRIYPAEGESWDAEDLEKIRVFEKMIFTFHAKARLEELVERRTYTDQQLNIRNLPYMLRLMSKLISRKEIHRYGACRFNLKGFSLVNARAGREAGTVIMVKYIRELERRLAAPGTVGRVGGDNFICLFRKEDLEIVRSHMKGYAVTFDGDGVNRMMLSAVAGYYLPGEQEEVTSEDQIMDRVVLAYNAARQAHETNEMFYCDELRGRQTEIQRIELLFPEAIKNSEFKVYYQPKVNLDDYRMVGAEALCRWERDGKVIFPSFFIPVLEQSVHICTLDFYMLEKVCRDMRRWLDAGREPVRVSVNFSRRHLGDIDLSRHILSVIDNYEIPHEYIEIELTETTTDVEFNDLKRVVTDLQEQGISTSVDDFGTGYSSLNLIRELPWNVIKLDRSFLPMIGRTDDSKESIMLRHVIRMVQDLGMECIVEGVETQDQANLLMQHNCFLVQGYFFDRPLPVHKYEERLDQKDGYYKTGGTDI